MTFTKWGLPCPHCESSDAVGLDDNDWYRCFSCDKSWRDTYEGEDMSLTLSTTPTDFGHVHGLDSSSWDTRGLEQWSAAKYGVKSEFDTTTGELLYRYYPVIKESKVVGYKRRDCKDKKFTCLGDGKKKPLFGSSLFEPHSEKPLVITEGEEDALAVYQALKEKYPNANPKVVSLPDGANITGIRDNLDYIRKFKEAILLFDNDTAGQGLISKAVSLIGAEKVRIGVLKDFKDPCEALIAGKPEAIVKAVYNAEPYKPDGIVTISDIYDDVIKPIEHGFSWPWPKLTEITYGIRRKELYGFGAATAGGKTEVFKEIIQHLIVEHDLPVGLIFLEEEPSRTVKAIAGKLSNKRFHVPDGTWTQSELINATDMLMESKKVYLYNHFGKKSWDDLKTTIRYMVAGLGIKDVFLDHLTALDSSEPDENKALSIIMEEMASLTQELDFTLYYISHLATPDGKPHEEGGRVMLRHFRGSRAIGFWTHFAFGMERNQQAEDEEERHTVTFRVLKDRNTGMSTGQTIPLKYDHDTGRLLEKEEDY